jgi:hypothetical protein
MGFDIVYLPPIHPIGMSHRKGRNNDLQAGAGDPGSPWAIGSAHGGHKSVHTELGTLDDFTRFREEAERLGLEIALDIAFQCSPDHPYVAEHPLWFAHRPDGSVQYAENPPKKYEDIYPLDFGSAEWSPLWQELRDVVLFWIAAGIRVFRVDNPHTKPFAFWGWLIADVQSRDSDVPAHRQRPAHLLLEARRRRSQRDPRRREPGSASCAERLHRRAPRGMGTRSTNAVPRARAPVRLALRLARRARVRDACPRPMPGLRLPHRASAQHVRAELRLLRLTSRTF